MSILDTLRRAHRREPEPLGEAVDVVAILACYLAGDARDDRLADTHGGDATDGLLSELRRRQAASAAQHPPAPPTW